MSPQLANSVVLATRGECAFTAKAKIAQAGGATGLLVINDNEGIKKEATCHVLSLFCLNSSVFQISMLGSFAESNPSRIFRTLQDDLQ